MELEYYYNKQSNGDLWRNNLVYTSLISKDKKTFVQYYANDTDYHKGKNQVVDPALMEEKWLREVNYLTQMRNMYPDLVPVITNIDLEARKLYLEIDGPDFWQRSIDGNCSFDEVLPDWQDQMLDIIQAHRSLGLYKYSMHPSSYFIVDGKLKSINYFFTYSKREGPISIAAHQSHLSDNRKADLRKKVEDLGMDWNGVHSLQDLEYLCWESFRTNYPDEFVKKVQACIK